MRVGAKGALMSGPSKQLDVVGIMPAAGQGKRLAPMPCSKELFPVGFRLANGRNEFRPKVVSHYLLEKFSKAGIKKVYVILRQGKWDIPAYFCDGAMLDMHLAYLVIAESSGPPDTVDRVYPFVIDNVIAFGFPDIMFGPDNVYRCLLQRQQRTKADIVLGLFPAHDCRAMDMVDIDRNGSIRDMVLKPVRTQLRYAWLCGVWTPVFTEFLHRFVASYYSGKVRRSGSRKIDAQGDLPVGAVLQAAIRQGIRAEGVTFPDETYIDIGTPAHMGEAIQRYGTLRTQ